MVSFSSAATALFGTLLLSSFQPCLALPALTTGISPNYELNYERNDVLLRRDKPQEFFLRIMPLGASIVAGENGPPEDTEKNGFRKLLRDKLRSDEWDVNMVGNHNSGSMKDNVSSQWLSSFPREWTRVL